MYLQYLLVGGISLFKNVNIASSLEFLKTAPIQNQRQMHLCQVFICIFQCIRCNDSCRTWNYSCSKRSILWWTLGAVSLMLVAVYDVSCNIINAPELFNKSIPTLVLADEINNSWEVILYSANTGYSNSIPIMAVYK